MEVIGREHEISIMRDLLQIDRSSFVAVYGRRRIGKTFLIDAVYRKNMVFSMSGLHDVSLEEQLQNFTYTLAQRSRRVVTQPRNWLEAFQLLISYCDKAKKQKKVIFFDELPWLCSARSGFLSSLEHFWNSWASKRKDIILIVCGSAASWMIKNIVQNKGGLHNRLTQTIRLMPFNLRETELMLLKQGVRLTRFQIAQLYMSIGGVPYYLKAVPKGKSVEQIINTLCFKKDGLLRREFEYLFQSLFNHSTIHLSVVNVLSKKHYGLSRADIIRLAKIPNAGSTTRVLEELEESGFIVRISPLENMTKDTVYRLIDFYTLFYMKYIDKVKPTTNTFLSLGRTTGWNAWLGYSFENLCLLHVDQILSKMGISGVNSRVASWIHRGKGFSRGTQIDIVIDRDDQIVSIFEVKFTNSIFTIDKSYSKILKNKLESFREFSKTKKSLFLSLITPYGVNKNMYELELVQNSIILDDLYLA